MNNPFEVFNFFFSYRCVLRHIGQPLLFSTNPKIQLITKNLKFSTRVNRVSDFLICFIVLFYFIFFFSFVSFFLLFVFICRIFYVVLFLLRAYFFFLRPYLDCPHLLHIRTFQFTTFEYFFFLIIRYNFYFFPILDTEIDEF